MQLMSQSKNCISALEMHRQLNVSYNTAWLIKHKIMQMMHMHNNQKISGYIEIDESQLEVSPVEVKAHSKQAHRPFIAALETQVDGKPISIKLSPVKDFDQKTMGHWLEKNIGQCKETLCSNAHCYKTLCEICQNRIRELNLHRKTQRKFNWLPLILSNIKASIYGTLHSIDYEHYAYRYLADIQYRFNRRFDLKAMFYELINSAALAPHAVFFKPDPLTGQMQPVE